MKKTARELQKEQTKALLLKTAYNVFSEKGIMNTRVSDIAQAAGVSHGTIFVHFRSQEAMIEEVVAVYGQKIALRTHTLAQSCGHLSELLRAHLHGIMEFEPFYTRLVIENRLLPTGAKDSIIAIQSAISFHFSQAVQRELKSSQSDGIPSYLLFNMWMGLVHYYLANGDLFAPEGHVIRRYGGTLIQSFMKLLTAKEEK
ncbi:TetR/AcrR family transcriptional regulator [Desulfitobacterium sp. Sab5]|uniref:TetR/AcrR family transcriptional regulator n=1 Tax=Desulfitobacterium nosdiversum TaxID=3375356 RepID=UPI003CF9BF34